MRLSTVCASVWRSVARGALFALWLGWGALAIAAGGEERAELLVELEQLEQLAEQHGVVTEPPGPRLGTYTRDLGTAVGEGVRRILAGWDARFEDLGGALARFGAKALILLSASLLLLLLARWIWRQRRGLRRPRQEAAVLLDPLPPERVRESEDWARQIEQDLAAGRVVSALEALWWWLACLLAPTVAEASWTSRELIVHGDRPDLLPQVRQLDRLIYGAAVPQAAEVHHLWRALREKLR